MAVNTEEPKDPVSLGDDAPPLPGANSDSEPDTYYIPLYVNKPGPTPTIFLQGQSLPILDPRKVSIKNQAKAIWDNPAIMTPDIRDRIEQAAQRYSQYSTPVPDSYVRDTFFVSVMNSAWINRKSKLSILDIVNTVFENSDDPLAAGGDPGSGGPSTNTYYQYTPEKDANRVVQDALQAYLGRSASADELKTFRDALRTEQEENPSVVYDDGAGTQTRTGGLDAQNFAAEWAKSQPEFGNYQAATTFVDGFLKAIG